MQAEEMRLCLQCFYTAGKRLPSTHIAAASNGMQWFECPNHEPTDNPGGFTRITLQPLNDWLREQGLEDMSELGTPE
jgi:hypothetical protein